MYVLTVQFNTLSKRKAGVCGGVAKLACKPGLQSGKYSRHFDSVVNVCEDAVEYTVTTPLFRRSDCNRVPTPLPCAPAHELADDTYQVREARLRGQLATTDMPRIFKEHALARRCAETGAFAWPFAIYLDGVKFAREDTCLGIWLVDLVSQQRWAMATLRKSELCQCGCHGWCSMWPVMRFVNWCCESLASGRFPTRRHDGADLEPHRAAFAGSPLGFYGVILYIKGDWMEFATTLGFPSWKTLGSPCPKCECTVSSMYELRGMSSFTTPWGVTTFAAYLAACDRCEIVVDPLTDATWRRIRAALVFDRRQSGGHGRCLSINMPEVLLQTKKKRPA